jgi:hypothetical protein
MKTAAIIPTTPEFLREALIVIGGAIIAAVVLSQFPSVRAYIQKNMGGGGIPGAGAGGCTCDD